jgi:hypothetical protein
MGIKDFFMGVVETALDVGASFIPGGSIAKKMAKKGLKGLARATGMAKDLFAGGGGGLSELAANFGDYQKGADKRMGDMEKGLQGMGDRVGGLEQGLKGMGNRMGNMESEMKGLGDRTEGYENSQRRFRFSSF